MRFTAVCVAFATSFLAHAVMVPFSLRQTAPEDAIGTFNVGQFLGGGCPGRISHSETANEDGVIPHSVMSIGPNPCVDDGAMPIFTDPNEALELVQADTSRALISQFINAEVSAIYGVENSVRDCTRVMFPVGTLVIIFQPVNNVVIGLDQYFMNRRYMIVDDPEVEGICRYSAPRRVVEAPMPEESPEETEEEPAVVLPAPTTLPEEPTETDEGTAPVPVPVPGSVGGPDATVLPVSDVDTEEESEEPSETPDDDPICFPADGSVQLEDGSVKRMDQIEIGDSVMVGKNVFSEVFMFSHRLSNVKHTFVKMELENGQSLEATSGHYIYVNGVLSAASRVKVGDSLELMSGDRAAVSQVSVVMKSGLFNPQTLHGDIVVNGVRASTFTQSVEICTATALMAPLRFVYALFGWSGSFLDGGLDSVANMLPNGAAVL